MTHITARFLEQEERVVFTMGPVGFLYSLLRPSSVFRPPVLQKQTLAVGCVGYETPRPLSWAAGAAASVGAI